MYGLELLPETREGRITTIGMTLPKGGWEGRHFAINTSGFVDGNRLQAELLHGISNQVITGYDRGASVAIENDGYETPLAWRSHGTSLPNLSSPLRVRLYLVRGNGNPQFHALYLKSRK
jgi:hypothetical protein